MLSRNPLLMAAGALLLLVLVLAISCKGSGQRPGGDSDLSLESVSAEVVALRTKVAEDITGVRNLAIGLFALALVLNVVTIGGVLVLLKKQQLAASGKPAAKAEKPVPAKPAARRTPKAKTP